MARVIPNIVGHAAAAVVVAKSEGALHPEKYCYSEIQFLPGVFCRFAGCLFLSKNCTE